MRVAPIERLGLRTLEQRDDATGRLVAPDLVQRLDGRQGHQCLVGQRLLEGQGSGAAPGLVLGARDTPAGIAVLLELARTLSTFPSRRTMIFAVLGTDHDGGVSLFRLFLVPSPLGGEG